MFKGEKTIVFWIGLIVLGYSISQLFSAVWQFVYFYSFYSSIFEGSTVDYPLMQTLTAIPLIAGGIIFLIIGLYLMKVGVKKLEIALEE